MSTFKAESFFALGGFEHAALFRSGRPVWEALGEPLDAYLAAWQGWEMASPLPPGVHVLGGPIFIAPNCRIEPGAVLRGPMLIGEGCEIRTGAYLRGRVVLGKGCVVGAHTEVKGAILLDGAYAPHQDYVGDSILGRKVNLGAGTILSNVKNIGQEVSFHYEGKLIHTGLRKFGAVLGDGCRTGCNTVMNPGVLMGPECVTYPNISLRSGYYPPRTLIKLRQDQQQVMLEKLGSE
jgi:NDP-sugar pyrophosphorylase family protein